MPTKACPRKIDSLFDIINKLFAANKLTAKNLCPHQRTGADLKPITHGIKKDNNFFEALRSPLKDSTEVLKGPIFYLYVVSLFYRGSGFTDTTLFSCMFSFIVVIMALGTAIGLFFPTTYFTPVVYFTRRKHVFLSNLANT